MSSLRERVEDLIAKWRANVEVFGQHNGSYLICADELSAALAAEGPGDAVAWLIERGGLCLGFCDRKFSWLDFTDQSALRFSRRSDAIRFIEAMRGGMNLDDVLVTEHMWAAAPSLHKEGAAHQVHRENSTQGEPAALVASKADVSLGNTPYEQVSFITAAVSAHTIASGMAQQMSADDAKLWRISQAVKLQNQNDLA